MINLSNSAIEKIKELIEEEGNPDLKLRVFVQGGGCSGFQYGFMFEEIQNEDDFDFTFGDVKVIVDSMSNQYLQNAEINYVEDITGSQFTVKNPDAKTTCGCGSSFSVDEDFYDNIGV